jgi:hypothetical protein
LSFVLDIVLGGSPSEESDATSPLDNFLRNLEVIFDRCFGQLAHRDDHLRLNSHCETAMEALRSNYVLRHMRPLVLWGVSVDPVPQVVIPLLMALCHTAKILCGVPFKHRRIPAHGDDVLRFAAH